MDIKICNWICFLKQFHKYKSAFVPLKDQLQMNKGKYTD